MEICGVGGYNYVGKNMTAIRVDNEVVIIDMGLHLDNYIRYTEDEDVHDVSATKLLKVDAIPNDDVIKGWRREVKAIIATHAHLDHVGAITFLANKYYAPIFCTPYTAEIIKAIAQDEKIRINNRIKILNPNSQYVISNNLRIEFIHITHSTPQTVMVALHTKDGILLYANDFKFDNRPIIGKPPNYKRLENLGKKGIKVLIVDSTRAKDAKKTPSETVAKEMLRDILLGTNSDNKAVIVTTFSSHLARLKSIIEFGKRMDRKVVLLGRSLYKYIKAGEAINLINFSKDVEIIKYGNKIRKKLKKIMKKGKEKYLLIVTGHQGEKKATLSKMARGELPFRFSLEDHIIFSCNVIPTEVNIHNRRVLEEQLAYYKVRIFEDIHVSGHASGEDLRDLINLIQPEHIIPAHGDIDMKMALVKLAQDKGYLIKKNIHLINDGEKIIIK